MYVVLLVTHSKFVIATSDENAMDSLVLAINEKLSENNDVLGVTCAIRDPVLLSQGTWRIHNKLV
jgi:hypothetical protein